MAAYKILVPPAGEPVSLALAKSQCRVDFEDDDDFIQLLITAAREYCENFTQKAFVTQQWEMVMDAFPGYLDQRSAALQSIRTVNTGGWFWLGTMWGFALPYSPVQSVDSVGYNDQYGNPQTLTVNVDYTIDIISTPARIFPVYAKLWPLTQFAPNGVTVKFTCGYGAADSAAVPQSICQAILLLVNYWYNNRSAYLIGQTSEPLQRALDSLLWLNRDMRF